MVCIFIVLKSTKHFSQYGHLCGRSPLWRYLVCVVNLILSRNRLSQNLHGNLRSSVWIIICLFRVALFARNLPHTAHSKLGERPQSDCSCPSKVVREENDTPEKHQREVTVKHTCDSGVKNLLTAFGANELLFWAAPLMIFHVLQHSVVSSK